MLAVIALPVLLLSQMVLSNPTYRDLIDLVELLDVEKRYSKEELKDYIRVCNQDPIELGLVIDSSVSIPKDDFRTGQEFLKDFLSNYTIGPGKNEVRVAAVTFGRGVYEQDSFNFSTYKTKDEVLDHVVNMKFRFGTRTDTGDAIKHMREKQMQNTRSWAPKIVIVLTDGNSQRRSWTKQQAAEARAENITIFAVGVGRSVSQTELLNIAGDPERVIQANSYDDLKNVKEQLAHKTCVMKPRPTTTPMPTTTPLPQQPCKDKYPSDINFIFSPASLGIDSTSWVTQFISHTLNNEELESGFQYGVVSGDCPDDAGFALNAYTETSKMRAHLNRYDRNNLPTLVSHASTRAFTAENGARDQASKIAVIFVGKAKVDNSALSKAIAELQSKGVTVFISEADPGVNLSGLPQGVRVLEYGSSMSQASALVTHICHMDETM
ncbi:collagen alpha-5(VI) chain-like isoform X2 [Littorina saxatilis]|uniref:VWFA domain-containing protein n=1 Tax=Littorina saxatilis TaxID=31220 RepID=A0AAN9AIE7_9CAEN